MKILICILYFSICMCNAYSLTLWVSPNGNDNNTGIKTDPFKTLYGAYDRLLTLYPAKTVDQPVTINITGSIFLAEAPITIKKLIWEISGTTIYPITITSYGNNINTISRPLYDSEKNGYIIELLNANYVSITNLQFNEATVGIFINSSDHCLIQRCKFYSNYIISTGGAGVITITRYPENTRDIPSYNKIRENYIKCDGAATINLGNHIHYHGVYIGQASQSTIEYNTIINAPGYGVHYFHNHENSNLVYGNIINGCYDASEKGGLILSYDSDEGGPWTIYGNSNKNNYISFSYVFPYHSNYSNNNYVSPNDTRDMLIHKSVESNNSDFHPNYFNHATLNGGRYAMDPFWIEFNADLLHNRMVSGDFDGDGFKDDIAAMQDLGSGNSKIYVWLQKRYDPMWPFGFGHHEMDKSFVFGGAWWSSSTGSYDAGKVTGRIVSGDFNGDGRTDIAALYDDGNRNSRIHTWLSTGSSFSPNGYANTWWTANPQSYDATKVTGRLVSGDFDNNGLSDIAAMYDYGNSNAAIHTWMSNGSSFTPTGSANTWWTSATGGYNPKNVTNRFVSGDFNGDSKSDIAALYDYGSGNTSIHTWISNGTTFNPTGYANTWWTSPNGTFYASRASNRVVSGDFNNDGVSDLAVMYDVGALRTALYTWTSNSNVFLPAGNVTAGWYSDYYDVSKVNGRLICGDFNNDGKSDVTAMHDYTVASNFFRTRFHVWEHNGNTFDMQNGYLGYPWLDFDSNLGGICSSNSSRMLDNSSESNTQVNQARSVSLYPNPCQTETNLKSNIPLKNATIRIFNIVGHLVKQITNTNGVSVLISTENIPAGSYLITVSENNLQISTAKLIVTDK